MGGGAADEVQVKPAPTKRRMTLARMIFLVSGRAPSSCAVSFPGAVDPYRHPKPVVCSKPVFLIPLLAPSLAACRVFAGRGGRAAGADFRRRHRTFARYPSHHVVASVAVCCGRAAVLSAWALD